MLYQLHQTDGLRAVGRLGCRGLGLVFAAAARQKSGSRQTDQSLLDHFYPLRCRCIVAPEPFRAHLLILTSESRSWHTANRLERRICAICFAFFTIGSSEVSVREAMNLSYLAESMKQSSETTFVVNGYADAATGTKEYNEKLARQRAEAVINVLVEKYGVDRDKLSVGTAEAVDSFGEPILNRVVVVESAQ